MIVRAALIDSQSREKEKMIVFFMGNQHVLMPIRSSFGSHLKYWAQLFEGRLALNPGLNETRVSFSSVQKLFFG